MNPTGPHAAALESRSMKKHGIRSGKKNSQYRHGDAQKSGRASEYLSWRELRTRCRNPHNHAYARYGGRGIRVCDRWMVYENFLADMGRKPSPRHSIDRIDNDGNYEPGNCRWATSSQQNLNRSSSAYTRGTNHHSARLNEVSVRIIRRCGELRVDQRALGVFFGVSQSVIWNVIHLLTWRHVPEPGAAGVCG